VLPLLESGEILQLGPRVLRPFYETASHAAQQALTSTWADAADWAVHVSEGAFFLGSAAPTCASRRSSCTNAEGAQRARGARRVLLLWGSEPCRTSTPVCDHVFAAARNRPRSIRRLAEEVARCS